MSNPNDNSTPPEGGKLPPANTGNASNPTPHTDSMEPENHQQLLDEKAEKYLREGGNIEDMPDPQEELDAEETMQQKNKNPDDRGI